MDVDSLLRAACDRLGFLSEELFEQLQLDRSPGHQQTILTHIFSLAERPREHSVLAGAIAMWHHYQNAPNNLTGYLKLFGSFLRPDVVQFIEQHQKLLDDETSSRFHKDFELSYPSVGTLIGTYLAKINYDEDPAELLQFCWLRIAVGEFADQGLPLVLRAYRRYSDHQAIPATPTIFNMGFKDGAPSSCMIYSISDSLEDIMDVHREIGLASKNNAGTGVDLSGIRHSAIGRQGISKGVVPLTKYFDEQTHYVDQGGRRHGAMTVSIRVHHIDTYEFIQITDRVGEDRSKVTKVNTSVMLSDLFMKRCLAGDNWTLFCPHQTGDLNLLHGKKFEEAYLEWEQKAQQWKRYRSHPEEFTTRPAKVESREYPADTLMEEICRMQINMGMPYIVHGCNTNRKNNMCNVGPVRSMNLCQEITIPAIPEQQTGCCNLASISLPAFVEDGQFNLLAFGYCVQDQVLALNAVIDQSKNISQKAIRSNVQNRPIGIGVSGFADMCHLLDLPPVLPPEGLESPGYSPQELRERVINPQLAQQNYLIWSCMYYNALYRSKEEAKRVGPYPNFWTSPLAEGRLQYHLWQEEQAETGREYPFQLEPAEPSTWGQEGSWTELIEEIKQYGVRNALLLTCMPTASTAQIPGNCESTEFHMQNIYTKKILSGDYPILNHHLVRDLEAIGLWSQQVYQEIVNHNGSILSLAETGLTEQQATRLRWIKEKYLTMWELPQRAIIELAAQRQVFIDQSQSMNLYFSQPTVETLKAVHTLTWELGLKTGMYYLRTRGANDAIKLGPRNLKITEVCTRNGECLSCQ